MSYKHVRGKGIWLLALSVAAMTLSACLPQEDYIEKTSDATTGSRKGAQGSYYASLLSTTSGRLQQAFATMVNNSAYHDDPYGPVDMNKIRVLGQFPSVVGEGDKVKAAYCSGQLVSWIDPGAMGADVKTAYARALDEQVGQSGLGTVQGNRLVLKSGATVSLVDKCNNKLPDGALALAAPIALPSAVAANSVEYDLTTGACASNGFSGFIGNVKLRKQHNGAGNWEIYDASECKLDSIVSDVTNSSQQQGIDLSLAALSAAMKSAIGTAATTDCSASKVGKRVIKKDKDGNPVKDSNGGLVYETVYTDVSSSCVDDIKVDAAAKGYTVETAAVIEKKVKNCESAIPAVQTFGYQGLINLQFWSKNNLGANVQNGLQPAWTGTYGSKRTNTVVTIKDKDGRVVDTKTSYGEWKPDTVSCVRVDKFRIPCQRFRVQTNDGYGVWENALQLKDATLKSGDYITIQRKYIATSYAPSTANDFNPDVKLSYDWKYVSQAVSGQCQWEINSCTWQ